MQSQTYGSEDKLRRFMFDEEQDTYGKQEEVGKEGSST